ncbi:helix-turn-helix domain-containing protein [Nocardioides sp. LMS-CY]|uniref:helix-turn-helix domain-containing protein n=1 Tax=Nocardioides sp. (strain LMS-CY) TaxID=2840457 RepID=UPI001BFFFBAD|nr:helix-turn-helix domain-containing protein [Nocardioides sp. LMS-CY]
MPRTTLSDEEKELGRALGAEIRRRRGERPASALASSSGVNLDTWRRVEQGRVPTPGFFLVADIAGALRVGLDELATAARRTGEAGDEA